MTIDLFDVLDISLREDSFTSLIVQALRRHETVARGVFQRLTGKRITGGTPQVHFRKPIQGRDSKNHPDIRMVAETDSGVWWLVIESKIMAPEGYRQCECYRSQVEEASEEGKCAGATLVFLTLQGDGPGDTGWDTLRHRDLVEVMDELDPDNMIDNDEAVGPAWQAYRIRLVQYDNRPEPDPSTQLIPWLQAPATGFITVEERCTDLAKFLAPPDWDHWGCLYVAQGRQQCLLGFNKPCWITGECAEGGQLELCVSVHFELDIPYPYPDPAREVTCRLHCETNPYMTKKQVESHGESGQRYHAFADAFKKELHPLLVGTSWRPANRWLQKAKLRCALIAATPIGELSEYLVPQLLSVEEPVTEAMISAAKECNLPWWRRIRP